MDSFSSIRVVTTCIVRCSAHTVLIKRLLNYLFVHASPWIVPTESGYTGTSHKHDRFITAWVKMVHTHHSLHCTCTLAQSSRGETPSRSGRTLAPFSRSNRRHLTWPFLKQMLSIHIITYTHCTYMCMTSLSSYTLLWYLSPCRDIYQVLDYSSIYMYYSLTKTGSTSSAP